jgi:hypothetical protein
VTVHTHAKEPLMNLRQSFILANQWQRALQPRYWRLKFFSEVGRWRSSPMVPSGAGEQFAGYGIMGLPFTSGHVLALRRFPVSSIGPGYTSVWHRDPEGKWAFYSDVDPHLSCTRFFGNGLATSERSAITLAWDEPRRLTIAVWAAGITWEVQLAEIPTTRLLNGIAAALPSALWRQPTTLAAVARVAAQALGTGRIRLLGRTPNGQRFRAVPTRLWLINESSAQIGGVDLGAPGPLTPQPRLGDFLIPQRGLFVIGSSEFEPGGERFRSHRNAPRPPQMDEVYARPFAGSE